MNGTPLITQQFTLAASQFRVWDLLATSILQSMPVEQTEIVNDSTMRGVLRFKFAGIIVPLRLQIEVADDANPQCHAARCLPQIAKDALLRDPCADRTEWTGFPNHPRTASESGDTKRPLLAHVGAHSNDRATVT